MTRARDVLEALDLGNSVAEFDADLERYFVATGTFRKVVKDEVDIVAGDKGTGKTALYRSLQDKYVELPQLDRVEVIPAFNPSGSPIFQRLAEGDPLDEGQYVTIWKAYFLSLVGNWILHLFPPEEYTDNQRALDALLRRVDLRTADDSAATVFSQVVNRIRRILRPRSAELAVSISAEGMPVFVPRVEFEGGDTRQTVELVRHDDALSILNATLEDSDVTAWIAIDRLDEAFQGFPAAEIPALRALFRTYLDMVAFDRLRLKLFVRKDLFRRIIQGGFVNLTHVNARKVEITWDDDDLFDLLCRRLRESHEFLAAMGLDPTCSNEDIFRAVFPRQVDPGSRKPSTWTWIVSRIRDGNDIKPPRNLIDLVKKSQDAQLRRDSREGREYLQGEPIITSDALKAGLAALSNERVQDTLLAEAGDYAQLIERFRDGKAEHNDETLSALFGVSLEEARTAARVLLEIGFLEQVGESYKVPMIYRDGLHLTQGKAF